MVPVALPQSEILYTFGKRIRDSRITQGWSQEELAERAQIDRSYVSSVERGRRNVSIVTAVRISQALGVSLSVLIDSTTRCASSASDPSQSDLPNPVESRHIYSREPLWSDKKLAVAPPPVPDQIVAVDAVTALIGLADRRRPCRAALVRHG